jgi:hypothetical protein
MEDLVGDQRQAIDHEVLGLIGGSAEVWRFVVEDVTGDTQDDRVRVGNPYLEALLRDGVGGVEGSLRVGFKDVYELAVEGLLAKLRQAIVGSDDPVEADIGVDEPLMHEGSATGKVELLAVGDGLVVAGLLGGEICAGERLAVPLDEAFVREVIDPGVFVERGVLGDELALFVVVDGVFEVEASEVGFCVIGLNHALKSCLDEGHEIAAWRRGLGCANTKWTQEKSQNGGNRYRTKGPHDVETVCHR